MKNKIFLLSAFVMIVFACSEKESKTTDIKKIVLKQDNDVEVLSRFVSNIEYIELKYPEDSLVGPIVSMKLIDDDIIVKQRSGNALKYMRFSGDGEFLNEIGHSVGFGKLQSPNDILGFGDNFAILDEEGVHTTTKQGRYIGKIINATESVNSFFYSSPNFYLFHESNGPGYLAAYNTNGEIEQVFKTHNLKIDDLDYSGVVKMATDSFHLFSPINDTIFTYSNNQLIPKYLIQGEKYPTIVNVFEEIRTMNQTEKMRHLHTNKHWVIKRYFENSNYLFVMYRLASDSFYQLIRKSNWEVNRFERVINDIDGGIWDYPMYLSENNELYIPLGTYQITGHKILNKKRFDFEDVKKRNVQSGNPVIMKCKLK